VDAQEPQLAVLCNNLAAALEELGAPPPLPLSPAPPSPSPPSPPLALAASFFSPGAPRDADALYVRALSICEANFPPSHPRVRHILDKRAKLQAVLFQFPGLRAR